MIYLFQIVEENNMLQDGTLIDLCGATLLWRSAQGLTAAPVSMVSTQIFKGHVST